MDAGTTSIFIAGVGLVVIGVGLLTASFTGGELLLKRVFHPRAGVPFSQQASRNLSIIGLVAIIFGVISIWVSLSMTSASIKEPPPTVQPSSATYLPPSTTPPSEPSAESRTPQSSPASSTPAAPDSSGPSTYLGSLPNQVGNYTSSLTGVSIGKVSYPNSLKLSCFNYRGGGKAIYDVASFHRLKATVGLPSDVHDFKRSSCTVNISDSLTGRALAPPIKLVSSSGPTMLDISLENVSQLQITAADDYPYSKGVVDISVAFGDATLS
ncbi:hypothetical protein ACIOD2_00075 [Amycolatopsis sp. NPDC088138]|uniref:hypothetical protein n=1 Tax=Amycolatopsis sp. NPDC088138 TaxID=3363938 RepID=UPI0037F51F3F